MDVSKELLAPCGLYCGVCSIQIAYREGNQKLKEKLAVAYGVAPEDIRCRGCMSDEKFGYCAACPIRDCATGKGLAGCYQCEEWPCALVREFPIAVGREVMLRAIPEWRELGTEKWVEAEEARYRCPSCGEPQFRGARRCKGCGEELALG